MANNETVYEQDSLVIHKARAHNLKSVDLEIPRDQLIVFTGLSGSGKSSLAFDTIYAEGQRRYLDTFSAYARQFLGGIEKPPVDAIEGLSPVISIEQKTVNKSPRSTVGTVTEIYDFLRLLFARAATAFSSVSGEKMIKYSEEQLLEIIRNQYLNKKIAILAPLVKGRKGHYKDLLEQHRKRGFVKIRIDGKIRDLAEQISLDRYKTHDIELVIDRIVYKGEQNKRLEDSVKTALKYGKGIIQVLDLESNELRFLSKKLMCPTSGIAYENPEPNSFSFNSPYGACKKCEGLGVVNEVVAHKLIPDANKSIAQGAIEYLGKYRETWDFKQIEALVLLRGRKLSEPFKDYPESLQKEILYGCKHELVIKSEIGLSDYRTNYDGLAALVKHHLNNPVNRAQEKKASEYFEKTTCSSCKGARLNKESLQFLIGDKNIHEISSLNLDDFAEWIENVENEFDDKQKKIASEIVLEIKKRTKFLLEVGLNYLSINRSSATLSGGEAQRIRLATQIGTELVGVLYILDEPSIGLHQRDNEKLIKSLVRLKELGNSVIVVEHDKDMMVASDYIVDIGPGAGLKGGEITAKGNYQDFLSQNSLTAQYLSGKKEISVPEKRRKGNGKTLELKGATGNNLKDVHLKIPLGTLTLVTGVSGSGKSTLINKTLYPVASNELNRSKLKHEEYKEIINLKALDKVIDIDQSPIGRTPRSNPATYTKVFDEIRKLFAATPEAKIRGYKPGRFSFNTKGGRCEACEGAGLKKVEMNFLPDVFVECDTCFGKRYNRQTLEVRFKGKSISDVLEMTINQACEFFENIKGIHRKIQTLQDVGLGYLKLGQQSTTLSGGEAQRVKLASELAKRETGSTLYILDEPSTGLHFEDIKLLMNVINKLVDNGNTVVVIEHNLDIIKCADYIIDLGPEGGKGGGQIIFEGTPEEMCNANTHTARFLKEELK